MALPVLLRSLESRGLKKSGTGWIARCPAHEDNHASLSISQGAKGAVVHCHAGCKPEEIVERLGFALADLFDETISDKPRIVAEYDYRDEQGARLYQSVRMLPKDFRQRRPGEGGGWEWNLQGVRRVLYRLPELLAAPKGTTVYVVEGEKDVDALTCLGLVATTNVGGAGKWRPEYGDALRGRPVVILPDNDDAGAAHGLMVAKALGGIAASTKVVQLPGLPSKGDVSDWLAMGGTKDKLLTLAAGVSPALVQAFAAAPDRIAGERTERVSLGAAALSFGVRFLDDALGGIVRTDLVLLGAKTGIGKTALATIVALHNCQRGKRVHYFALEAEEREIERRMKFQIIAQEYYRTGFQRPPIRYLDWHMGRLDHELASYEEWADAELGRYLANLLTFYRIDSFTSDDFRARLDEVKADTDLVVLDHLHYVDSTDDNENRGYKRTVKAIRDSALNASKPVIVVAHVRKGDRRNDRLVPDVEDFHGSSDIPKMATKAIMLAPAYEAESPKPFLWPTYMQVVKCRLDSSLTRYAAMCNFNTRSNCYEEDYLLGKLTAGGSLFAPLSFAEKPAWASDAVAVSDDGGIQ